MISETSIHSRVFLQFSAAIVICMAGAWWTATTLVAGALEQRLNARLQHTTGVLAAGVFPFTEDLLVRVAALQNAEFALLRDDGTIGLSTLPDPTGPLGVLIEQAAHNAAAARQEDYDLVIRPLPPGRSLEYVAVAGLASLADVRAATRRAAWWLGAMALAAVAVMAGLGAHLSRAVAAPLQQLGAMAERVAAGDREVRASAPGFREMRGLTVALNDMTEKLATYEAELLVRNRLANLGEMASRVAHEIRNPLTAMKLQAEMLAERVADPGDQDTMRGLVREIQRLELVVAGTLELGRPAEIHLESTDLNRVVSEVTALIAPQFTHRHI